MDLVASYRFRTCGACCKLTNASVFVAAMHLDATHLIERLEVFEERACVRLEALFVDVSDGLLTVNGELHPREGTTIKQDIEVHMEAYNSSGRLVAKGESHFSGDKFFGFEVFQMRVNLAIGELSKIRVYPKQGRFVRTSPPAHDRVREFIALVVGIKYHRGHAGGLTPGDLVQLVREPDNIHDSNAVQVKVLADELLGYIPGELAATLAQEIDAGMCTQARVSRFIRKSVYLAIIVGKTELDIERFVLQK